MTNKKEKEHLLLNLDTRLLEKFTANKNFAGWGIPWRNTKLEFNSSYSPAEQVRFLEGLRKVHRFGEQHPGFMWAWKLINKLAKYDVRL